MNQHKTIPISFTVGETVEWVKYSNIYKPSDGWQLSYSFKNDKNSFDVPSISKIDYYLMRIRALDSANMEVGKYWWQLTAWQDITTKDEEWHIIDDGEIEVKPNLALLDCYDGRLHVEKVLDALEACLLSKASRDQMSYSIAGRSLSRMNPTELLEWRDKYKAELVRTKRQQGKIKDQIIKVRFGCL